MKKIAFIKILILATMLAASQSILSADIINNGVSSSWELVVDSDYFRIYVDTLRIALTDRATVTCWEKMAARVDTQEGKQHRNERVKLLAESIGEAKAKTYTYATYQAEYNCKESKVRLLHISDYNNKGELIRAENYTSSGEWTSVEPNSIGEATMKIACGTLAKQ